MHYFNKYIKKYKAISISSIASNPLEDNRKIFSILLFNYMIGNTDNHRFKNALKRACDELSEKGYKRAENIYKEIISGGRF